MPLWGTEYSTSKVWGAIHGIEADLREKKKKKKKKRVKGLAVFLKVADHTHSMILLYLL
jgi:hypothetical protein